MHESVETVTGIGGIPAIIRQTDMFGMEIAEGEDILFTQHHTLRGTCRTAGV